MAAAIRWVFFDVGNVIFNDDPAMAFIYEMLYRQIRRIDSSLTFAELLSERERLITQNSDGKHYRTLGERYLGKKGWYDLKLCIVEKLERNYERYNPLIPGIEDTLRRLSLKYKLGVVANQVSVCRKALVNRGLLAYFSTVGISAETGLSKPDVRFFQMLLRQAKCLPDETVMIGDRIDNDILPANKVGMKTIRLKLDLDKKGYLPDTEHARLYFASQHRAAVSQAEPRTKAEKPTLTVTSLDQIPYALEKLSAQE